MSDESVSISGKTKIIGIYGISGSGKSSTLQELPWRLYNEQFKFFEGSEEVFKVSGGQDAFNKSTPEQKKAYREQAIKHILDQCQDGGCVGVVSGHFTLWDETTGAQRIDTTKDWEVFTHVLYLDGTPAHIAQCIENDQTRKRHIRDTTTLQLWQNWEKEVLPAVCSEHGVLFTQVHPDENGYFTDEVVRFLRDFAIHDEDHNTRQALQTVDKFIVNNGPFDTIIVLDADKTLAEIDTGNEFWKMVGPLAGFRQEPLTQIFGGDARYSYFAFRQAALLYESIDKGGCFEATCAILKERVQVYEAFQMLIKEARHCKDDRIGVMIITSGIGRVWELALSLSEEDKNITIVSGNRIKDGFVVTPKVKGAIVAHLKGSYGIFVSCFGDSPLDIEMLREADEAVVVVGTESSRSRSMEQLLFRGINNGLEAQQLLINTAKPRLDTSKLPLFNFDEFLKSFLLTINVYDATDKAASMLLTTPTRHADIAGPHLQKAHRQVGHYLAIEYIATLLGTEQYLIPHVQGNKTFGHRVMDEKCTLIVPIMRGGGPLAEGVHEALPNAMFHHAHKPNDIPISALERCSAVILADYVINTGKSIDEFVAYIRERKPTLKIVVVAGVVQADAVRRRGILARTIREHGQFEVVTLRVSTNKYTGSGGTDTGNRLFNTTDQA